MRPGAACEPPACYQMPAGHSFLHIPKTGGTSFEKSAASLGIEVLISPWSKWAGTRQPLKGEGAPWHLPPDMFEARHRTPRSPARKPLLCIVRNPADRLRSEVAWRCALAKKERRFFTFWTYNSKSDRCTLQQSPVTFMAREARQVLQADRRSSLHFADDRVLHMLPQSWYVWAESGAVTCNCVVSYDKLARLAGLNHQNANSHTEVGWLTSPVFPRLYRLDEELYVNASTEQSLCYRPSPLTQAQLQQQAQLRLWSPD